MGSWFKKHISKPSKAVVKGIVRTPTNIVHSVTNVVHNPLDLKAWGNLALQANPVTAIPRSMATESLSPSLNRKIDLVSGIGATALVSAGVGTIAKAGILGAEALASSPSPSVDTGGEVLSPTADTMPAGSTSFSDYASNGEQLLNNTPAVLPANNSGNFLDTVLTKGSNFLTSLGSGLKTNLAPNTKTATAGIASSGNATIIIFLAIAVTAMIALGMGSHKK